MARTQVGMTRSLDGLARRKQFEMILFETTRPVAMVFAVKV